MKPSPKKGHGQRFLECLHYESCLDFAALQNWKDFTCEDCSLFTGIQKSQPTPKQENVRICEKCGKSPTIQPTSPLCASCIGKQAWQDGKAKKKKPSKKKAPASLKIKEAAKGQDKRKAEIGQPRTDFQSLFTGKYSHLRKELEKVAEEEIRTVDEQIIYIIKTYLSNTQHPEVSK